MQHMVWVPLSDGTYRSRKGARCEKINALPLKAYVIYLRTHEKRVGKRYRKLTSGTSGKVVWV